MIETQIAIPTLLKVGKGTMKNLGTYLLAGNMKNAVVYF